MHQPRLRQTLLRLMARDLSLREALAAQGVLQGGYHPRMEEIHRDNARQLRALIETFGWPGEPLAGADGAEAAWLIAQHAIGEPGFMRHCRDLLRTAVAAGNAPGWQLAYLDDRIRVSEGGLQRWGTQFEITPQGPVLSPVEDPAGLDERRSAVGLAPVAQRLQAFCDAPRPSEEAFAAYKAAEQAWRVQVGWLSAAGENETSDGAR